MTLVNSLPTKKLQVEEKTKDRTPGLTLQPMSLNPNTENNILQNKEKDINSVINTLEDVAARATQVACVVRPINCQLKTNEVEIRQSDTKKAHTCSQQKEEKRPVIKILKRESKPQVGTRVENSKNGETVQSNRKQKKKDEGEKQQREEQERMGSRRDEKEMNYLNHEAQLVRNVDGNEKKQEKEKINESSIPMDNLAKRRQSASKISTSANTEQKSKENRPVIRILKREKPQVQTKAVNCKKREKAQSDQKQTKKDEEKCHNGKKLIHPPTKLQTTSSVLSTKLNQCHKVPKAKPERGKQPTNTHKK